MTIDELGYDVAHLAERVEDVASESRLQFNAIHREFGSVHDEMRTILRAIEAVDVHLSAPFLRWSEESAKAREGLRDLDYRVRLLEGRAS